MPEMELTSTAFADGAAIPVKHSCDGQNLSPPLAWSFCPEGTRSLALIVHDPDAPSGDFTHWLAWNIDPEPGGLGNGTMAPAEGLNGREEAGYMGPCPPPGDGPHRYFHEPDIRVRADTAPTTGRMVARDRVVIEVAQIAVD